MERLAASGGGYLELSSGRRIWIGGDQPETAAVETGATQQLNSARARTVSLNIFVSFVLE